MGRWHDEMPNGELRFVDAVELPGTLVLCGEDVETQPAFPIADCVGKFCVAEIIGPHWSTPILWRTAILLRQDIDRNISMQRNPVNDLAVLPSSLAWLSKAKGRYLSRQSLLAFSRINQRPGSIVSHSKSAPTDTCILKQTHETSGLVGILSRADFQAIAISS